MSLPSLPEKGNIPARDEAVNMILASIAMEELGLSHIINAEGEKLQYALGTIVGVSGPEKPATIEDLLGLNKSIHQTLNGTMMNQFLLREKLQDALAASVMRGPTGPTGMTGPQGPLTMTIEPVVKSLDPGTAPTVENIGPDDAHVRMEFGIPRGATGGIGATGATGPAWTPVNPLFTVSETFGTTGGVSFGGTLGFASQTLDVSVGAGPSIRIESKYSDAGAIIPFASGIAQEMNTQVGSGAAKEGAAVSFGNAEPVDVSTGQIDLSAGGPCMAFPLSAEGTITSMAALISVTEGGVADVNNLVSAQLYESTAADSNIFTPIADAVIKFDPIVGIPARGTVKQKVLSDIDYIIDAGTRLLMVFIYETPGHTPDAATLTAFLSGSIMIK